MNQILKAAILAGVAGAASTASAQTVEIMLDWTSAGGSQAALMVGETVTVDVYAMLTGGGTVLTAADFTMEHSAATVTHAVIGDASFDVGSVVAVGTAVESDGLGQSDVFATYDLAPIHLFSYDLTATGEGSIAISIASPIFNTLNNFSPVDHTLVNPELVIEVNTVPAPGFLALSGVAGLAAVRRRRG